MTVIRSFWRQSRGVMAFERMIQRAWPKVGIILVNWNAWRDTIECLESLRRLEYPNFSTYVVDNDSADGSADRLKEWDRKVRVIPSGSNRGWAGGCNVGIRAARNDGCKHIFLLNNDALVEPDTVTRLVEAV